VKLYSTKISGCVVLYTDMHDSYCAVAYASQPCATSLSHDYGTCYSIEGQFLCYRWPTSQQYII